MKVLRHSSPIIIRKSVLTCCKAEFASFFFLSGFSFTNIHNSHDSRGSRRLFLYILSTTSTRFTDTQALAGLLLQRAHSAYSWQPDSKRQGFLTQVANHEARCSLEFALSILSLVAAVVRKMLKTRVTLRNISFVLLNLIKRLLFVIFKDSPPSQCLCSPMKLLLAFTFAPLSYLFGQCHDMYRSVMICI